MKEIINIDSNLFKELTKIAKCHLIIDLNV